MRFHQFRTVGVVLSAVMVALSAFASPALAANTRQIYIGDPGPSGVNGELTYSRTRPGGLSVVYVEVRNDGGQTINHASLLGGYAADTAAVNPLFPPPSGPSLPSLLTFAAAYPTAQCTLGPDGSGTANRSLDCDLGQLPGYSSQTFTIVIQTPTRDEYYSAYPDACPAYTTDPSACPDPSFDVWFGVYLAETNSTGTNQDNFYAIGTLATTTPTCSPDPNGNKDANYFLPDTMVSLFSGTCASAGTSNASLVSKNALTGQGGYGEVSISDQALTCPAGYTCFGTAVVADVLDAGPVPGGLEWTIKWTGVKSLSGVIHFWDTYDATDPAHASDYTVIPFTKKSQCSARLTFDCWVTTQGSKGNADPWWFTATFITKNNGKAGGFF